MVSREKEEQIWEKEYKKEPKSGRERARDQPRLPERGWPLATDQLVAINRAGSKGLDQEQFTEKDDSRPGSMGSLCTALIN